MSQEARTGATSAGTVGLPRRAASTFLAGDPDTGWFARIVGTVIMTVTLATARPPASASWAWACYAIAALGWLTFVTIGSRRPHLSLGSLAIAALTCATLVGIDDGGTALILICVSIATVAAHTRAPFTVIAGLSVGVLGLAAVSVLASHRAVTLLLTYLGVIGFVVLSGLFRRQYHVRVQQTEALLEQTRLAQAERARAAALDERTRIAREMHDVLAHSLGALGVQLEVAEALLSERAAPDGALERVRRSRRLARDGLTEARTAVAALRTDVPSLPEALAELAGSYRRDHEVAVEVSTAGTPRALSSAAAVSLLGTAREALTNAGRHAPGSPVDMVLDYGPEAVRLRVCNHLREAQRDGRPDRTGSAERSGGNGLAGMRERLALAGGTLHAGRQDPASGDHPNAWQVVAEVPE